jgi:hypothetical protein
MAFPVLDWALTQGQYPDEVDESCLVHLDGPDLGEHFARPYLTVTGL